MRLSLFCVSLILIFSYLVSIGQEKNQEPDVILDVLNFFDTIPEPIDTVSDFVIVYEPYLRTGKNRIPTDIVSMVKIFYSPGESELENTEKVLGFLENAYSEHAYHESGSWDYESGKNFKYIAYPGELPSYTKDDFVSPIKGEITSGYGYRVNRHKNHYGIDIPVKIGDSIKCALPGVVTRIGFEKSGYGNYIVVSHDRDLETIYAHLSRTIAKPGQKIISGEIIGLGGSTGNSTGPHLHFETRLKGQPINPFVLFNSL